MIEVRIITDFNKTKRKIKKSKSKQKTSQKRKQNPTPHPKCLKHAFMQQQCSRVKNHKSDLFTPSPIRLKGLHLPVPRITLMTGLQLLFDIFTHQIPISFLIAVDMFFLEKLKL